MNVVHPEKSRRIDAMDEIKRALEAAEYISFKRLVVHIGERFDTWSPRTMEYATTALEHLGAFAKPLGVRVLVENLTSDASTPEHLMTLLDISHLDQIGVCLDLGHAHMSSGVAEAIGVLGPRIAQVHVHDNHGLKDDHLWPGDGTIEWPATIATLRDLPSEPAAVLEIGFDLEANPTAIPERIQRSFQMLA